jgi:hypothetical protein
VTDEMHRQGRDRRDRRVGVRRTVALLVIVAALIYGGFLARGFFGEAEPPGEETPADSVQ